MTSTEIGAVSGRLVDLLAPDWRDVALSDIAHGLSRIARWNGQTRRPISVAEHSLVVAALVAAPFRLAALLHDAHEAYVGDIARPVAIALGDPARHAIERLKERLDGAIARRIAEDFATGGVPLIVLAPGLAREFVAPEVRRADGRALALEDAIRFGFDADDPSPTAQSALSHYGAAAPEPDDVAARWLVAVEGQARARAW